MKFGKEFASQMVPEWREAYLQYAFLKTVLKEIQDFKHRTRPVPARATSLKRNMTLYRAFSGLTHLSRHSPTTQAQMDIENQVILVNSVRHDGTEGTETTFMNVAEEGGEYELTYFKRLDEEFNKVLKFYKGKVDEVVNEASELTKQMNALIAFRIKVERPDGWVNTAEETARLAAEVEASTIALSATSPSANSRNSSSKFCSFIFCYFRYFLKVH